jgi:hypothetical protein
MKNFSVQNVPVFTLAIILISMSCAVQAQNVNAGSDKINPAHQKDTSAVNKNKKTIILNPGFTYLSDLTYAGRKNVIGTPVLTPYFNLISTKGFFLSATGYINATKNVWSVDGAGITPGYSFDISKHFNGFLSGTKYFLSDSSSLILASMKGSIDGGLNYTPQLINIGVTFDYIFSKQHDFLAGLNISRDISIPVFSSGTFKISPTAAFTAGTQSFFETYYKNVITKKRIARSNGNPLGGLLGGGSSNPDSSVVTSVFTQKQEQEIRSFNALDISFYIPVNVHYGKFLFNFTPNLIFPFNQVNPSQSNTMPKLDNPFFFFTAGISMLL